MTRFRNSPPPFEVMKGGPPIRSNGTGPSEPAAELLRGPIERQGHQLVGTGTTANGGTIAVRVGGDSDRGGPECDRIGILGRSDAGASPSPEAATG